MPRPPCFSHPGQDRRVGKRGGQARARWESHDERWGEQARMGGGVGEPGREVGG